VRRRVLRERGIDAIKIAPMSARRRREIEHGRPSSMRFAVAIRPAAKTRLPDAGLRTRGSLLSACQERGLRRSPRPGDGRE
jgi:hypothetical protein